MRHVWWWWWQLWQSPHFPLLLLSPLESNVVSLVWQECSFSGSSRWRRGKVCGWWFYCIFSSRSTHFVSPSARRSARSSFFYSCLPSFLSLLPVLPAGTISLLDFLFSLAGRLFCHCSPFSSATPLMRTEKAQGVEGRVALCSVSGGIHLVQLS